MTAAELVTRDDAKMHVCRPPKRYPGNKVGLLWICPDCWSEFLYRPVASGELGRVINLWVRFYEPGTRRWVPLDRRGRGCKR